MDYEEMVEKVRDYTNRGMEYLDILLELKMEAREFDSKWRTAKNAVIAKNTIILVEGEEKSLFDYVESLTYKERQKIFKLKNRKYKWERINTKCVESCGIKIVSIKQVEFPKMICDTIFSKNVSVGWMTRVHKCRRL